MKTLKFHLNALLTSSFSQAFRESNDFLSESDRIPDLTQSTQSQFGHYQCNNAMRLAKKLGQKPRDIAQKIVTQLEQQGSTLISKVEIAGPGFINIWIDSAFLAQDLDTMLKDEKLGIALDSQLKQKIVVDFSSPNTAKEMHVGHLRSTIIGDSLCRVLEFMGHDVLRLNHIGDWGTAFGMLIAYIKNNFNVKDLSIDSVELSDLVVWYKQSKLQFDNDPEFKKQAQECVVALQGGDPQALELWKLICHISSIAYHKIYDLLDIKITDRGESYYNPLLKGIVEELEEKGLVELSEGAKCVYLEGYTNREGEPLPFMVQKADGGYNYSTTDLAALKHRVIDEKADRLIYVVDAGQSMHLKMLFAASEKAGYYDPNKVSCEHVAFGVVLGADNKKFKTRSGETVRLMDLLQTAIDKAQAILVERQKNASLDQDQIAQALGINAIKYADLSCNRINDYVFSFDRMLRFEGNTAAFLMYAYVRIAGIKRKIADNQGHISENVTANIHLEHPCELALGMSLRQFDETLERVAQELTPNTLCEYLYQVAEQFNAFFRDCRVEGVPEQAQRLLLCDLTAKVLKTGLTLLGLTVIDRM